MSNLRHDLLKMDAYLHITSPIRQTGGPAKYDTNTRKHGDQWPQSSCKPSFTKNGRTK